MIIHQRHYRIIGIACLLCLVILVWNNDDTKATIVVSNQNFAQTVEHRMSTVSKNFETHNVVDELDSTSYDEDVHGDIGDESDDNFNGTLCQGWCRNAFLSLVECSHTPLQRLRTAFQIENCAAALQSSANLAMVNQKVEKIADDTPFTFFRGAAALFDYNMMCADPQFKDKKTNMPRVYSNGDCHPENFGVMVMANSELVWGVNDFDQTFQTPFSWDLKRGATGFALACKVRAWADEDIRMAAKTFIDSYMEIITQKNCTISEQDRFVEGSEYVTEQAPLINSLFEKSRDMETNKNTLKWLRKMGIDTVKNEFIESDILKPMPAESIPEFQASIDAWLYHGVAALAKYPNDGNFYQVLAVAKKYSSGTGSVGLNRYWILIKGRYAEKDGFIILEMKQEVNSVLEVFFRYKYTESQEGKRAEDAERSIYPYANLFYGWTTYRGRAFIVRERSKHSVSADIYDMSKQEFMEYSGHGGRALALSHIRARCPNHQCELSSMAAVDVEMCKGIVDYVKEYDAEKFAAFVLNFAIEETYREVQAWDLLRSFVNERRTTGTYTDILNGGARPSNCDN